MAEQKPDEYKEGPLGTMLVIQGIPKGADVEASTKAVEQLVKQAGKLFDNMEHASISNTPLPTATEYEQAAGEESPMPKAALMGGAVMSAAMSYADRQEDIAESERYAAMSDEERAVQRKKDSEYALKINKEAYEQFSTGVNKRMASDFAIAEKWADKPNLTPRERCHGVIWETQKQYGDQHGFRLDENGRGVTYVRDAAQEYAKHYDTMFVEEVKQNLTMAGAKLFS